MTISPDDLTDFCVRALGAAGVSDADAWTTADVLVTTDTMGVFTHGTKSLRGYLRRLRAGGLRADARPAITAEGPAWAIVDGGSALGMVAATFAMQTAIDKAAGAGIAYVGVRNTCHFGAAGFYAHLATLRDMVGVAMANDIPTVSAPGSRGAVTGSNPLACAIPAGQERPILLDMAISTVAGGKVYAARNEGRAIPDNWIVGPDGQPSTDSALFPEQAALTPMAGHKGYGLALLIESLAALATGAAMTWQVRNWIQSDPSSPTGHGAAFVAINVGAMNPIAQFKSRVDELIGEMHNAPRTPGAERIYVPGEMEWERRDKALAEGIALPADVIQNLRGVAEDLRLDLPAALRDEKGILPQMGHR
jgi:LDH2 family malate/lactate/ureidoglycolate dehydrogenase